MEIRKIQGVIISSLFVLGLAGCSNSSSWSQDDESPWKSKRDAEMANASSEEFIEVSVDEAVEANGMEEMPVVEEAMPASEMVEPEVIAQPELESISDFDPEPVPVEEMSAFEKLELDSAEPEVVEVVEVAAVSAITTDIMSASSTAYAVQVYAGRVVANVNRYQSDHNLDDMQMVKTDRDGDIIYVLVGVYEDYESAVQALIDIEQSTGSTPWVRSVAGLQNMSVE